MLLESLTLARRRFQFLRTVLIASGSTVELLLVVVSASTTLGAYDRRANCNLRICVRLLIILTVSTEKPYC